MGKELREMGRLQDIALDVTKSVVTECLDDLRDVEECDVD
jgi:hypothetical protein